MAAAFRPVNSPLPATEHIKEDFATSPMTPRPTTAPAQPTQQLDEATTPTRATFSSAVLASQKPLPSSPFPESIQIPELTTTTPRREGSQRSRRSKESDDVDMDDSDGEGHGAEEGAAGSDDESVSGDGTKSKKKKSQRFYCTDYPPCNLSFTRRNTLANARFNATTVHVNEDIPIDSLAATGTRFQRQIRTDRVRQPGRARSSTAGSMGPGARGHSKSLSTSSINSVSSIASGYSVTDARRRPPPLIMADPRSRHSLEAYRAPDGQYYRPPSPGDFSTPTSATFSTGQNSPRWAPVMSPASSHSRSHSMYSSGSRTPGRRLSVPSGGNPFQSPHGPVQRGPFGPSGLNTSNNGAFSPAPPGSLLASPTVSSGGWSRRDSVSSVAEEAWRRRTWHPDTREYNGASRLSQVISSSQFPPDTATLQLPSAAAQQTRLPGIESFDELARRTPPRRVPSPMMIDSVPPNPPMAYQGGQAPQWDPNLDRGLNRLDISTPPRDGAGAWANEANQALLARAEQARVRFEPEVRTVEVAPPPMQPTHGPGMLGPRHQHTVSAPAFHNVPRESRRHGWYNGPAHHTETIHEGRPHVDRIVHPNISSFQGFPAREQLPLVHQQHGPGIDRMERIPERPPNQGGNPESLKRLEALVAVATSEGSVGTAY
ncbi:Up in starvation [Collariella sp. IMI 366227]|nr:Up in starvation [Collariella sp. IMI 366227]